MEKDAQLAGHQSSHNSGVIHSGIYYRPDSLKARTVAIGRRSLLEFCRENGVAHDICGKVIVASDDDQLPRLHALLQRAQQSSVDVELIGSERLRELEPHAIGVGALHVPSAGIVDFQQVCEVLGELITAAGGDLRLRCRVLRLTELDRSVVVQTNEGDREARVVVNCAGLHADRIRSGSSSSGPQVRIVPFRGEYHTLAPRASYLVRSMIYPVPDPDLPFLGVHFTRTVYGEVHAGPNAVLALAREGYARRTVEVRQLTELLRFSGFRRLALRQWRTGLAEFYRSLNRRVLLESLRRLVPEVRLEDLVPAPSGVRAQAVDSAGNLVDDFAWSESARVIGVLNAPSPAATASLEIGRLIASRTLARL